jgi:hypothetical protein
MLIGTADVRALGKLAPHLKAFATEPWLLNDVACLQLTAEMRNSAREPVLPPALHPTIPPVVSLQVWDVMESEVGAFGFALCRVSCRSGVRARGFTTAAVTSSEAAAEILTARFGFPCAVGRTALRRHYDGVDAEVAVDGKRILGITALDPEPMGLSDVQYTGNLNLAHTPVGLRLVQVEIDHVASRVERLTARLSAFDGEAWGNRLLDPYVVVSASVALESISFQPVRFVCRPDELAFTGTEPVAVAEQS